MSDRSRIPLYLLVLAAFLAPISGGQLSLDTFIQAVDSPSEVLQSLFGGIEAPLLGHALLTLLCCSALIYLTLSRRIIQVPNTVLSGMLIVFLILLAGTTLYSEFKSQSIVAATEWLSYGAAFYAVVAGIGRKKGPVAVMAALTAGCAVLALLGINEYGQSPPNWRIFSIWSNPNALAAMLLPGFFCGLALTVVRPRTEAIASAAATLAIGVALVLTQSKGGLLALAVGIVAIIALVVAWSTKDRKAASLRLIGVLGLVLAVSFAMQFKATSVGSSSPITRVSAAQETSEQSAGFRMNLWKTSLEMAKQQPVGYGLATFRFESARPGITTQTQFAHNLYLQLLAEASPVAVLLFLAIACYWFYHVFRASRRLPIEQNLLRAGVIAAVVSVGAHSMIDSDLYYYGVGIATFMLLGVGLLLAGDAVAPENLPAPTRRLAAGGATVLALGMLYFGYVDAQKALLRGAIVKQNREVAQSLRSSLQSLAPNDSEVWNLSAFAAPNASEALSNQKRAVELGPSTRNLRSLARKQIDAGMVAHAQTSLQRALAYDPNNLSTLLLLADLQGQVGQEEEAEETLRRLIAVEAGPYFKVRSLPEIVPTETAEARLKLARKAAGRDEKIKLLSEAVAVYKQYRQMTLPRVVAIQKQDPSANFGGQTLQSAQESMQKAAAAATELAGLYREARNDRLAEAAEATAAEFTTGF